MSDYYDHMYVQTESRDLVWEALAAYIQRDIPIAGTVLDLGAGYCGFINSIQATRKIAVDFNPEGKKHAASNVEFLVSSAVDLTPVPSGTVDAVFSSNLFEHLSRQDLQTTLKEILRILKKRGRLILLQPNFYYAYREYFHDCTHREIYTHVGLGDLLTIAGFEVKRVVPRLLPMSMQKKYGGFSIPKYSFLKTLIKLYLIFPIKPFARQMYLVCEKRS